MSLRCPMQQVDNVLNFDTNGVSNRNQVSITSEGFLKHLFCQKPDFVLQVLQYLLSQSLVSIYQNALCTVHAFKLYTVSQKNIPDIFNFNLNKNYQILIIFGVKYIFLTQLAIKWPFSFSSHLMSASALNWERKPSEICVEIYRKSEKQPQHY